MHSIQQQTHTYTPQAPTETQANNDLFDAMTQLIVAGNPQAVIEFFFLDDETRLTPEQSNQLLRTSYASQTTWDQQGNCWETLRCALIVRTTNFLENPKASQDSWLDSEVLKCAQNADDWTLLKLVDKENTTPHQ